MSLETDESQNAVLYRLLKALAQVDCAMLSKLAADDIQITIPGARDLDITLNGAGQDALCAWAKTVHNQCGDLAFVMHRYFENGCEMMAIGTFSIQRIPRIFEADCAVHVSFEQGKVSSFKLLFDSYALDKFRGQMD